MARLSTLVHDYTITIYSDVLGDITYYTQTRLAAAQTIRSAAALDATYELTHMTRYVEWEGNDFELGLCYGCQARDAIVERDEDGPILSASCASPQCNWWDAVAMRDAAAEAGYAGANRHLIKQLRSILAGNCDAVAQSV